MKTIPASFMLGGMISKRFAIIAPAPMVSGAMSQMIGFTTITVWKLTGICSQNGVRPTITIANVAK